MENVYITAYSSLSALGVDNQETRQQIARKKQVIHWPDQNELFKKPYFPVKKLNQNKNMTRCAGFALKLLENIEQYWSPLPAIPIFIATSTGGIKETEEVYTNLVMSGNKFPLKKKHYFYDIFRSIEKRYPRRFNSSYSLFSSACSSAGHCLYQAFRLMKNRVIDKAIVLGVDALSITTMIGFDALKLISPGGTRPLTQTRDGLSLGDGGGILLLETNPSSEPCAQVLGVASNTDGYHITAPDPGGTQQKACIRQVLEQARIGPQQIDYINAHGTGTAGNDQVELDVIKAVFNSPVPVTSLKGFIGHTLGSSALTETAIILNMLDQNRIYQPENIMHDPLDKEYIPGTSLEKEVQYFIKNSFGFGGNNVCTLIKKSGKDSL